ncbi:hypothetical protein D3C75_1040240 [compost metagenome]
MPLGLGQDHQKLLATVARCQVGRAANAAGNGRGDLAQGFVAALVTMTFVERLEVIDIDHQYRQRAVVALGP